MPDGPERDGTIPTALGQIDLRAWGERGCRDWPIVLFGGPDRGIESWGDFPQRLSRATGSRIVAFARSGPESPAWLREAPSADGGPGEAQGAASLIGSQLGFENFIACGRDLGVPVAVEAAARQGRACLGLIVIGRPDESFHPDIRAPSADGSRREALSRLRCPVLALPDRVEETAQDGGIVSAIRDFLALSVFPLPIH